MTRRRRFTRSDSGGSLYRLLTGDESSVRRTRATARRSNSRRKKLEFEVESHIAREIFAVAYLAASFLLFLSIYGKLGAVGTIIHDMLKPVFGFGIHLIPIAFLGVSVGLFFTKAFSFTLSRITGLILLFVSILSIFHLSVAPENLFEAAKTGHYGGYVGFVTNFLFRGLMQIGALGAAIVFVASLLIGILLTFEVSIIGFLKSAKPEIQLKRTKMTDEDEEETEEEEEESMPEEEINIIKPNMAPSDVEEEREFGAMMEGEEERGEQDEEVDESSQEKAPIPAMADMKATDDNQPLMVKQTIQWEFPPFDILEPPASSEEVDEELLKKNAEIIKNKLGQFDIDVQMQDVHVGPTVIQYTLRPHEGVKLSKITGLKNDLALALAASSIRIEAPIPGKSLVGIEVPNEARSIVRLRELLESEEFKMVSAESKLALPLGRDVSGKPIIADLAGMPHLLIAGATGAGKSVGINSFLLTLLYQNSPFDLKMIMIDPKRVELNSYNNIPHLLTPVITDIEKAVIALRWATAEMNRRYIVLAETKHRNITEYNTDPAMEEKMPKIIVLVDELADLMMSTGKEVEASICRIAQMARAVGMHLIIATQRPSVDVITGLIKANMPARIAYAVSSGIDSRTILDSVGAEDLLGRGDMLYISGNMSKPIRIQGMFVSSKEIERVTNRVKLTMEPEYDQRITSTHVVTQKVQGLPPSSISGEDGNDPLYDQALKLILEHRKASASLLQRRLEVGYARAARILDEMEANGVIGPVRGAKPRDILISVSPSSREGEQSPPQP